MDLIGARKVQPPEAVAHGTDNHTASNKNPRKRNAYGDLFILFCEYYNLWRCLCNALLPTARGTLDFYAFQVIHNSEDLTATVIDALGF